MSDSDSGVKAAEALHQICAPPGSQMTASSATQLARALLRDRVWGCGTSWQSWRPAIGVEKSHWSMWEQWKLLPLNCSSWKKKEIVLCSSSFFNLALVNCGCFKGDGTLYKASCLTLTWVGWLPTWHWAFRMDRSQIRARPIVLLRWAAPVVMHRFYNSCQGMWVVALLDAFGKAYL